LQIRIAAGEKLPFRQEDVVIRGHAIECRVYAEDADNNFFPSPGKIETLLTPAGPGIRLDNGVYAGWTVPIDYDPLLAKLVSYGEDRQQAIARLARALPEYFVAGIKTNLGLFRRILADKDFQAGKIDTGYLERLLKGEAGGGKKNTVNIAAIAVAVFAVLDSKGTASNNGGGAATSSWKKAARAESLT
jgi:acetyl-CoA carboxylase, biotin carboxylase subunit